MLVIILYLKSIDWIPDIPLLLLESTELLCILWFMATVSSIHSKLLKLDKTLCCKSLVVFKELHMYQRSSTELKSSHLPNTQEDIVLSADMKLLLGTTSELVIESQLKTFCKDLHQAISHTITIKVKGMKYLTQL